MSGRIVLVTGTDTEVGKTFCTAALARVLARAGVDVRAVKPVESGCGPEREGPEDGRLLAEATGQGAPAEALQRLEAPLAPPVAADLEGLELDPEAWVETVRDLAAEADLVLCEGAGGLMSPLAWGVDALDLALHLEADALVVAADRLGTLNHTLLTVRALDGSGVGVAGIVVNGVDPLERADDDASRGRNAAALRHTLPDLPLLELAHLDAWTDAVEALAPVRAWIERPET